MITGLLPHLWEEGRVVMGYRYKAIINEESQEGDRELSNPIDTIGV